MKIYNAYAYDVTRITYNDEPVKTDVNGSPSETINKPHLERVLAARDEAEARKLRAEVQSDV